MERQAPRPYSEPPVCLASPPVVSDPPSRDRYLPMRIEFLNLHAYARQMEDAMDVTECSQWLSRLMETMPEGMRGHLLPAQEQHKRNSRALVFVPSLHVRPDVSASDRLRLITRLITHVKDQLATGAFDHKAGTPRARWEQSEARKPVNRLLAHIHRLHERLTVKAPELTTWRVQPRGTSGELWSMNGRPSLVLVVNPSYVVVQSACVGSLSAEMVKEQWGEVIASNT